jgi:hypothetical protein
MCSAQSGNFIPVVDTMLQNPDPADWLMWRRMLNSWGYSPLNQVDRGNFGQLRMVCNFGQDRSLSERDCRARNNRTAQSVDHLDRSECTSENSLDRVRSHSAA